MNLLTTNDAADRLNMHRNSIKRYCAKFGVQPVKRFAVNCYHAHDIEWIAAQRVPTPARQKYQHMLVLWHGKATTEQLEQIIDVYATPEHVREWLGYE
ncbi:MAG: helix-turn-helix domain-containing protein [Anaerolineae bacterium]|nr:helix-turn-helix domain-containing protein [Anaerolineae bacterium]MCO5195458.1 helix-turn-helix domain-containing protein [Anaerolineae bacterium]MCO5199984.1 helix-turn-helix domain-containing protein [Anaerolineae bacterium]